MNWLRGDNAPTEQTPKQIAEAIESSLTRLQTDYIDLYQLHWPDRPLPWGANPSRYVASEFEGGDDGAPMAETLEILQGFIKAGKARHIGISNESAWGTMKFITESSAHGLPRMQSIQNAYNLLNRTFDTGLAEIAMREHVSLLAYSPLAQGYLTGKYLDGARPAGSRSTLFNRGQRYELTATDDAIRAYIALAREFGLDPAQMAIAFVNQQPFVASTLIGATSMDQLATNIGAIDVTLTPEINAKIDDIHQRYGNCAP